LRVVEQQHRCKQLVGLRAREAAQRSLHTCEAGRVHRQRVIAHRNQQQGSAGIAGKLPADPDRATGRMAGHDDVCQCLQHRGVERVIERCDTRVVAVHRQQVLGEIVAPDRQEIHSPREIGGLVYGGRHLDHHADLRCDHCPAFLDDLRVRPRQQGECIVEFLCVADHRQHHAQIVEAGTGFQHRAHLREKNLRVIQRHTDATPTQKRVCLLDREVRQRLVATDVQCAHRHRPWCKGLELFAVDQALLFLGRKAFAQQERDLRAVEPHTLGASPERTHQLRVEAGIHEQPHRMPIAQLARQVEHAFKLAGQRAFGLHHRQVLLQQLRRGIDQHPPCMTIDDDPGAVDLRKRQIDRTQHAGDRHRAREYRGMRIAGTRHRDDPGEARLGYLRKQRCGNLLAHQHRSLRVVDRVALPGLQVRQHAPPQIAQVRGTIAQVRVLHQFEGAHMRQHHLAQRTLGPLPGADRFDDLTAKRAVVEQHHVGVEQRDFLRPHAGTQVCAYCQHF
jgi:hypothetical protein